MAFEIFCSILTPERILYEGKVGFAAVQIYNGETGFLYSHAPFISEMGIGEIRLRTKDKTDYFVVEGGFVHFKENELLLLAENAIVKDNLSKENITNEIDEFMKKDVYERMKLNVELKKLKARLKVASR